MIPFDEGIVQFFNQFARRSFAFDKIVENISRNDLLKGGIVVSLLIWLWFREGEKHEQERRREILLFGLFSSLAALLVARFLAFALPFRERPLRNPHLSFVLPYGMNENSLINWSSFPSDHAVLFFGLATTIFLVSRRAGLLAMLHALFIVCLPRIYFGIHYPTDILAGALLGVAAGALSLVTAIRHPMMKYFLLWSEKSPASFYAFLFLLAFQTAELFDPLRSIAMLMPRLTILLAGLTLIVLLVWWVWTRMLPLRSRRSASVRQERSGKPTQR